MARKSPAEKLKDLLRVTRAWETLRPTRSFFGHTLERFKQAIQASLDARAEIEDLQGRLSLAILKRNLRTFDPSGSCEASFTPCKAIRPKEGTASCTWQWGMCRGALAAGRADGRAASGSVVSGALPRPAPTVV